MADAEFERFKKMFPGGKKDMNIRAIPAPIPGPGGIGRAVVGKAVQSGVRRFSDVAKGDKVTKMKDAKGLERRDPMEPRVVPSGRSEALRKAREGGGGPTKMKDRRGLEMKPPPRKAPPSGTGRKAAIGAGIAGGTIGGIELAKRMKANRAAANTKPMSNADVQESYQSVNRKHGTDRPARALSRSVPARVKARPADLRTSKPEKKSERKVERKAEKRVVKASEKKAMKKGPIFKANWKNASPTEMQKRGGKRRSISGK